MVKRNKDLPAWYQSQLPSLDDCGPACASMILKFIGDEDSSIKSAKKYFDGAWTAQHFYLYLKGHNANFNLGKEIINQDDTINIVMSTYLSFNHWIISYKGQFICPIDGYVHSKRVLKDFPVISAVSFL